MDDKDRQAFLEGAKPVVLTLEGEEVLRVTPKRFSSGSVGWYHNARREIHGVSVQMSICITIVGSKPGWVPFKERPSANGKIHEEAPPTPQALFDEPQASKKPKKSPKGS